MTFWFQLQSLLIWMTHNCPPLPWLSYSPFSANQLEWPWSSQLGTSLCSKPVWLPIPHNKSQRGQLSAPHTSILLSHQPQSLPLFPFFTLLRSHRSPCSTDAPGPISGPLHVTAPLFLFHKAPWGVFSTMASGRPSVTTLGKTEAVCPYLSQWPFQLHFSLWHVSPLNVLCNLFSAIYLVMSSPHSLTLWKGVCFWSLLKCWGSRT